MKLLIILIIAVIIYLAFMFQFEPFAPRYDAQQQADEDEAVMQRAYRAYVLEGEESNRAAIDESNEIYDINTVPDNTVPNTVPNKVPNTVPNKSKDRGYNVVPSNLLRQAMGISGTYK